MKKISLGLAVVLGAFALCAAEVKINSAFTNVNPKTNIPAHWFLNAWSGYKPAPAIKVIKDGNVAALEFSNIKSKHGFGFNSANYFPCKKGQTLTVTARVKGKGKAFFQLQTFGAKAWTGLLPSKTVDLTADWKEVKVTLPVDNVKGKDATVKAMFTLGGSKGIQSLSISSIKLDLK